MDTINTSKTFFFGALIGGITGLLFAPKSGEKLRKDICSACKQIADDTKNVAAAATETVKDTVKYGKEEAQHLAEEAKDKIKDGVNAVKKEVKSHL